ncbi:DUF983 domain-containing protein [Flavivirga aquatica]|uniref:DUF983 domain-containing protein n=1 Tax=Flavivirga aquatica TaxID=1849968 RepID=A0A1E5TE63_9FLAO|nr:DUF983 domain-containing protein [Flavivirga aquatica]OEK09639.1 DUF983 domain-containing protein [Flavivirga aquatica]
MKLISIIRGKCPQCEKSNIFESRGNLLLFKIPQMHANCERCHYKFEKEPGFFFGAMFVSYAIAAAQFIPFFLISYFLLGASPLFSFLGVIVIAILSSTMNFRLSRIIWIYLFSKTKKEV